jgi:hypothetical protein
VKTHNWPCLMRRSSVVTPCTRFRGTENATSAPEAWVSLIFLLPLVTRLLGLGLQRRRTIDLILRLEGLGELEVRRGRGRGHVNFYRVHVTPEETVQSAPAEKVQSSARKGAISRQEKVQSVAPESKSEREKKGAPSAPFSLSPDKPETRNPFWCDAHGFAHSERLPDRRPDCAREK